MSQLGFTFPQPQQIIEEPIQENKKLVERKQRLLTELAAIETGIDIFDFLDPARNQLNSSVTDVPCDVELLYVSKKQRKKAVNIGKASTELARIIMDIGSHAPRTPLDIPRDPPKCTAIVNHAKVFFAQLKQLKDARAGLLTAFSVIPRRQAPAPQQQQEQPAEEEPPSTKRVHPFFPDVKGLGPLLGHMKEQLGEFPNFVEKQPTDIECQELRLAAEPDCLEKHLLEICGSSSDDEFDPDALLEQDQRAQSPYPHGIQRQ